jgi:hypothetical protein
MTPSRRRRPLSYYQQHPRAFEEARAEWDERELERHDREQEAREPRQDPRVDVDYRVWLDGPEDEK